ncbi:MAG: hypothetical protein HY270_08240 [Deltaproteobacteria bacterium]|nr:hypothetical protein [Deltaproteobacteria bacterium]
MANSLLGIFASAVIGLIAVNAWWQIPLVPAVVGASGAALLLYRRTRATASR